MKVMALGLLALAGAAAQPATEQAELEARLEARRAALEALTASRTDVKGALTALDRVAQAVAAQNDGLRRRVSLLGRRVVAAERLENAVDDEL